LRSRVLHAAWLLAALQPYGALVSGTLEFLSRHSPKQNASAHGSNAGMT